MIERITILGGSSVYIPELILSIIARNLNVQEIVLVGNPGRKLNLVSEFCQRILDKSGYPAKIIPTSDVAEGVKNAKYILNHVRVGGMPARMRDEMLPPKYGMLGHESLGAGGIANGLRTLPIIFEHARIIEAVNPSAVYINLGNPMGILMEGLVKYAQLNCVGMSDLPGTYIRHIARILNQDVANLQVDYIGLNHLGWIQDIKVDSLSKMSYLLDILEKREEEDFDYELIELFRMIPTRHTGMYFHRAEVLKKQKSGIRFRAEILHEAEKQILKLYENPNLAEVPELTRQRNAVWYEKTIVPFIECLEGTQPQDIILCIKNNGCIRDLPESGSVEIPVRVCSGTLTPRKVGSVPRFLKGLFLSSKESDRLTVEAAKHRSYECALQALAINPFVPSIETARKYLAHIIKQDKLELH